MTIEETLKQNPAVVVDQLAQARALGLEEAAAFVESGGGHWVCPPQVARDIRGLIDTPPAPDTRDDGMLVEKVGMKLGGLACVVGDDNLALLFCTYFDNHPEKPDTDELTDNHWHPWVEAQATLMQQAIARSILSMLSPTEAE